MLVISEFLSTVINEAGMSAQCGKYILPAACHFAFPLCHDVGSNPAVGGSRLKHMCRADCEKVQTKLCRAEMEFMKQQPMRGKNNQRANPLGVGSFIPGTLKDERCPNAMG